MKVMVVTFGESCEGFVTNCGEFGIKPAALTTPQSIPGFLLHCIQREECDAFLYVDVGARFYNKPDFWFFEQCDLSHHQSSTDVLFIKNNKISEEFVKEWIRIEKLGVKKPFLATILKFNRKEFGVLEMPSEWVGLGKDNIIETLANQK
jgi:hypothetical protein